MVMQNYTPIIYVNDSEPFVEADNLNKSEQQVKLLTDAVRNVQTSLESGQTAEAIKNLTDAAELLRTDVDLKANKTSLNKSGVGLANVDNTSDVNKPVSTAQKAALDLKADKTQLTKSGVGLDKVDNTADKDKPVSTAQKSALDKKVNADTFHAEFYGKSPTVITGDADVFNLAPDVYLIRSDTVLNTPPNTKVTCIEVRKTHDEVGSGGAGSVIGADKFEQGTISESSSVGAAYSAAKYPDTEPLHSSRIRTIELFPVAAHSTISVSAGFEYCAIYFDGDKKYLGVSTYQRWDSISRLTHESALFAGIALRKIDGTPILPDDATAAKLVINTLGENSGGSKLLVAWGAFDGSLHTCTNSAGAWGLWKQLSTPLPKDANEGDELRFRNGRWVAEAKTP